MRLLIENAVGVFTDRLIQGVSLLVEDGVITMIAEEGRKISAGSGCDLFDAGGNYLCPGFIDLHIHGVNRFSVDAGPEALAEMRAALPLYGVTGFLPTVCPLPKGADVNFLSSLATSSDECGEGAEILGFHLEGPFLSLTGALPSDALGEPDIKRVESMIAAADPYKLVFSVSPEFSNILELLPLMTSSGFPAFITHTGADVAQTLAAIGAGARHATHFYDVFPVPPVVEPGVRPCGTVEAILATPGCSVDFILDGVHVDPVAIKMAMRCLGKDKVCLITDANVGAGLGAGEYSFGGRKIFVSSLGAPARMENGGLAGSGLTMNIAVRNAVEMLNVDVFQAVRMASANPACVLGLNNRKGFISEGFDADLTLMDSGFNVLNTWVGGVCSHPLICQSKTK